MKPSRRFWRRTVEGANAAIDTRVLDSGVVLVDVISGPFPVAAHLDANGARRLAFNLLAAAREAEVVRGLR